MLRELLKEEKVIKEGHFFLTSGRHSDLYINKDSIFCIPELFRIIVYETKKSIEEYLNKIDIITGPAIAGSILAGVLSLGIFGCNKIFVYPEKHEGTMIFRRGYDKIVKGKNVWITEDIITTGRSVENTIDAVTFNGGNVIGVSCIWNKGNYLPSTGVLISLIYEEVKSYLPVDCPQCKERIKLQDPKGG